MSANNRNLEYTEQEIRSRLRSADELRVKGNLAQATDACIEILARNPGHPDTLHYLGLLEFHQGDAVNAIAHIGEAIRHNPGVASYYGNLGNVFYRVRRYDDAKHAFRKALELNPHDVQILANYAWLLGDEGHTEEAARGYTDILAQQSVPGLQVRRAMLIPPIPMSREEISGTRDRFCERVKTLIDSKVRLYDPFVEVGNTNFFLAYHGCNNRGLQTLVAHFYAQACPELLYTAQHCQQKPGHDDERIRIGFISRFFGDHSIGKTTQGLIGGLDREKFEVIVFFVGPVEGEIGKSIQRSGDHYEVLDGTLEQARHRVSQYRLDILLYPDIGMDSFTYFLAFSRLAHVQCTSFGHPDTTGIPNLDYFISTDCYETEDAEQHYSETPIRLKGVASLAYYTKPAVPEKYKPRESFGLYENENIYLCPQHLFKFHPDFDEILGRILRSDRSGRLILIEGQYRHWDELLMTRFQSSIPDVFDRIQFLPRQSQLDFVNLIAVADVMLDTIYFCGQNTTHEGLAAGTPIVTLPGELQRSRHTMCFLKKIGLEHCIAADPADYINIAVNLATDKALQEKTRLTIKKNAHRVWCEHEVILEHERFFLDVTRRPVPKL